MPEISTGYHTFASKHEPNNSHIRLITTFSVSAYLNSGRQLNTLIESRGYWISAKHKKENPALWLGFVNERHELLAQSTPEMLMFPVTNKSMNYAFNVYRICSVDYLQHS